ncbi:MAG: methyltransferase domain-containing protein [Clostridia bacterium]|nr:methyltransferase domain-containing protein [Clostridia bacterium]
MEHFICPVCGEKLILQENTYVCKNNHCFDRAKSGYVNLLRSQVSGKKRHGDDKMMIRARTEFLEKGYYRPLLEGILEECASLQSKKVHLCDIGCGEGWYTDEVFRFFRGRDQVVQMEGIDISKDALTAAAKRNPNIGFAVASISALPIESDSVDILLNLFAPFDLTEYGRVLKTGGVWLKAIPLEKHLFGLKAAIYEKPYENEVSVEEYEGFELVGKREIRYEMTLESAGDIANLFKMTPYYYKTSKEDQQKLEKLERLTTAAEFSILCYRKK